VIPVLVHKIEHLTSKWNKSENPTQSAIHLTSGRNMEDTLQQPSNQKGGSLENIPLGALVWKKHGKPSNPIKQKQKTYAMR
jgi:hypothetical protein